MQELRAPLVALRSSEGLCTLLYDPVDERELEAMGCGLVGRTSYNPKAINTTLFYEVPAACEVETCPRPVLFYGAPGCFPAGWRA